LTPADEIIPSKADRPGPAIMKTIVLKSDSRPVMKRLRSVLAQVPDRCQYGEEQQCRERLQTSLDRFCAFDDALRRRRQIAAAREHKERIEEILVFLHDLDDLTEDEADSTVFEEMALLFADLGRVARSGAAIMRTLRKRAVPSPR